MDVRRPNPWLVAWLRTRTAAPVRKQCLVAGCGFGSDAEALASAGFDVIAADVSPDAIAASRDRFKRSGVEYLVADALAPPAEWLGAFDFVFVASLIDSVPLAARGGAVSALAQLVAPGGRILIVCRAREAGDPIDALPWSLTREELDRFLAEGLRANQVDVVDDDEPPPTRRFVAFFERPLP